MLRLRAIHNYLGKPHVVGLAGRVPAPQWVGVQFSKWGRDLHIPPTLVETRIEQADS